LPNWLRLHHDACWLHSSCGRPTVLPLAGVLASSAPIEPAPASGARDECGAGDRRGETQRSSGTKGKHRPSTLCSSVARSPPHNGPVGPCRPRREDRRRCHRPPLCHSGHRPEATPPHAAHVQGKLETCSLRRMLPEPRSPCCGRQRRLRRKLPNTKTEITQAGIKEIEVKCDKQRSNTCVYRFLSFTVPSARFLWCRLIPKIVFTNLVGGETAGRGKGPGDCSPRGRRSGAHNGTAAAAGTGRTKRRKGTDRRIHEAVVCPSRGRAALALGADGTAAKDFSAECSTPIPRVGGGPPLILRGSIGLSWRSPLPLMHLQLSHCCTMQR
jgi:hypothetical protein